MAAVIQHHVVSYKAILIGVLLSIAVFSTTYTFGDLFVYPRLALAIAGFVVLLRTPALKRLILPPIAILSVFVFSLGASIVHDAWHHFLLFITLVIRGIAIPYFVATLMVILIRKSQSTKAPSERSQYIATIFTSALVFQALIAISQLLNPEFRSTYINFVNLDSAWREMASLGLPRFSGIGGISIYDTSITYCIFGAALLINQRNKTPVVWLNAILMSTVLLLSLLHGRTGLLFAIILFGLIAIRDTLFDRGHPSIVLRLLAFLLVMVFVLYLSIDSDYITQVLESAGELIINYLSGDGLRSDSTDELLNNYLIWPSDQAMWFGSGVWAQPDLVDNMDLRYSTDSGYLLLINFGGIPFMFIFFVVLYVVIFYYCKYISGAGVRSFALDKSLFSIYLASVFLISSIKGPIFLSEHFMTALFLMLGIFYHFVVAPHSIPASINPSASLHNPI